MRKAVRDFKEFVLKGDVVALAVAVIVATAFGAVVAAFVANVVTPLIAAIGGQPDFSDLDFKSRRPGRTPCRRASTTAGGGWRVVSVGEAGEGTLAAVLVKGED
jgi:large-conductance mechanosensitive channel